jgi:hypothetical protein
MKMKKRTVRMVILSVLVALILMGAQKSCNDPEIDPSIATARAEMPAQQEDVRPTMAPVDGPPAYEGQVFWFADDICQGYTVPDDATYMGGTIYLMVGQDFCLADADETHLPYELSLEEVGINLEYAILEINGDVISVRIGELFWIGPLEHSLRIIGSDEVAVTAQRDFGPYKGGWSWDVAPGKIDYLYPGEYASWTAYTDVPDGTNPQFLLVYDVQGFWTLQDCKVQNSQWICEGKILAEISPGPQQYQWTVEFSDEVYPIAQ